MLRLQNHVAVTYLFDIILSTMFYEQNQANQYPNASENQFIVACYGYF